MSFDDIIAKVRIRPELWRRGAVRNRELRKKIWDNIAMELNMDALLLKKRWKHLKDQYRKEVKKNIGKNEDEINYWKYHRTLEFLHTELFPDENCARDQDYFVEDEHEQSEHSDEGEQASTSNKRKYDPEPIKSNFVEKRIKRLSDQLQKHINACESCDKKDPDYMFLMSVLPSVKKLTDIQKLYFRGRINDWLLEAMTQNEYGTEYADDSTKYFVTPEIHDGVPKKD